MEEIKKAKEKASRAEKPFLYVGNENIFSHYVHMFFDKTHATLHSLTPNSFKVNEGKYHYVKMINEGGVANAKEYEGIIWLVDKESDNKEVIDELLSEERKQKEDKTPFVMVFTPDFVEMSPTKKNISLSTMLSAYTDNMRELLLTYAKYSDYVRARYSNVSTILHAPFIVPVENNTHTDFLTRAIAGTITTFAHAQYEYVELPEINDSTLNNIYTVIHPFDVLNAVLLLLVNKKRGRYVAAPTGKQYTLKEMLTMLPVPLVPYAKGEKTRVEVLNIERVFTGEKLVRLGWREEVSVWDMIQIVNDYAWSPYPVRPETYQVFI